MEPIQEAILAEFIKALSSTASFRGVDLTKLDELLSRDEKPRADLIVDILRQTPKSESFPPNDSH